MSIDTSTDLTLVIFLSACLLLTACGGPVGDVESTKGDVAVRTPVGDLSVRTDIDTRETGLPVYPGAQPLRDRNEDDSARVSIDTPLFGVEVVAAKYESADPPDLLIGFYRREMRTYGDVVECRGDVDFKAQPRAGGPTCNEKATAQELNLVVGTEDRHRMVSVMRRGSGSEFSIVYVHAREGR